MDRLNLDPEAFQRSSEKSDSNSKATPDVVARQAEILFSAYRAADFADARGFAAQLGVVLSEFSEEIVVHVTSPQTGIQRRSKWPPTISEVLDACEKHRDFLAKVKEQRPFDRPQIAPLDRPPGSFANVHVPEWHPRYNRMCDATKGLDGKFWMPGANSDGEPGIWIALHIWQDGGSVRKPTH